MGIRKRQKEEIVYLCLWVIVLTLYLVSQFRARTELNLPLVDLNLMVKMVASLGPFIVLFLINNYLLIPKYLLTNKFGLYILSTFVTLSLFMAFQWSFSANFKFNGNPERLEIDRRLNENFDRNNPHDHSPHTIPPRPYFPFQFFFDLTHALLIIGGNVAIALVFQRYDDRLEKEKLLKSNAENQLTYLKAQISPHFYMNMLNNIHGMIEIDSEKAQSMVLDMSRLMRYMLYESSKPLIFLEKEISFLVNYIELMKLRYDKEMVKITYRFPEEIVTNGIMVPPLLFLAFIENAFKHGVSYQKESFISISMALSGQRLRFSCMNTKISAARNPASGVGLTNIKQRLGLLFGNSAQLHIDDMTETFTVLLSIPYDDNKDTNH